MIAKEYKLPRGNAEVEFYEKKSRFIANISQVSSEKEAQTFLASIREKYKDANHNVFAYGIKEGGIFRQSDDGEPVKTAGVPLLDVFLKQEIYDFCCVATRYFGGIMLGAGGLIRAYARCGALALEASGVGIMRQLSMCSVSVTYAQFENIKRLLLSSGSEIISEDFGADVTITFSIPSEDKAALDKQVMELSAAKFKICENSKEMRAF